jgi:hypothetical protein
MTPLAGLARFQSEMRRPLHDRDPELLRAVVAMLEPSAPSPSVARALAYLADYPDASSNQVARHVGGRRKDGLAAVREARALPGTNGNQFPLDATARPPSGFVLAAEVA